MSKFLKLNISRKRAVFENISYLPAAIALAQRYKSKILDDYSTENIRDFASFFVELVEKTSPYFWVLTGKNGEFKGFVYLDDWQGSYKTPHCATVTTCIDPRYWGSFTKWAGKRFIKYVFKRFKLKKLKAELYSGNKNAVSLLKKIGFNHECTLKNETIVNGKPVNIELYSIIK